MQPPPQPHSLVGIDKGLFLAWRGVGNNQLNVLQSTDGITFGNKKTLNETTTARPALAGSNGALLLVWQGVSNNLINIISSTDGGATWGNKFTTTQTSYGGPAAAMFATGFIAWTGTDPQHHINLAGLQ